MISDRFPGDHWTGNRVIDPGKQKQKTDLFGVADDEFDVVEAYETAVVGLLSAVECRLNSQLPEAVYPPGCPPPLGRILLDPVYFAKTGR